MQNIKKNYIWLVMCLPALILTFVFSYIPMPGIVLAFKNFNFSKGLFGSDWVGFKNFEFFFRSQDFLIVTRNTVLYNLLFLLAGNLLAVIFAILMNEITRKFFLKLYQTIMFFPYFLSWIVVGYMLFAFLNSDLGILNHLTQIFGVESISWYSQAKYWPWILLFVSLWKGTGSSCVMFYASIIGIDREYYEAAEIDGANKFHKTIYITLPFITPLITLFILLGIGQIFRADFGMFYILPMNIGILQDTTGVIDTYVYNMMKQVGDMGMAASVGLYQSVVGCILILISNAVVKRIEPENSLF